MESDERRKFDHDHDLLVQVHTIVSNTNEIVSRHIQDDKDDFGDIHKRINKLTWYVAMGAGILGAIEFFKDKIFKQ